MLHLKQLSLNGPQARDFLDLEAIVSRQEEEEEEDEENLCKFHEMVHSVTHI